MNQKLSNNECHAVLKFWRREHPEERGGVRQQAEKIVAEELCRIVSRPSVPSGHRSSKRKVGKRSRTKKRAASTY